MKQILKVVLLVLSLNIVATGAWAQAGKLYSEGVSLMKQKRWAEAINKFEASRDLDNGASNKSKCDKQIKVCKKHLIPLEPKHDDQRQKPVTRISLKTNMVDFEAVPNAGGMRLEVANGDKTAWNFNVPQDAASWCSAEKSSDGCGLIIKCKPSIKTVTRSTRIDILSVSDNFSVDVRQHGIKASLAVSSNIVSAKRKGDQLIIPIVCTSDTLYEDGNNWRVLSAPKWCHQVYKKKPKTNTLQKAFLAVSNGFADTGKEVKYQEEPAEKNELVLNIDKLDKAEAKERSGDIVLECQGQVERFSILQK